MVVTGFRAGGGGVDGEEDYLFLNVCEELEVSRNWRGGIKGDNRALRLGERVKQVEK